MDLKSKQQMVQMPLTEYQKLLDYLEDMEDSLALRSAKKTSTKLITLDELKKKIAHA